MQLALARLAPLLSFTWSPERVLTLVKEITVPHIRNHNSLYDSDLRTLWSLSKTQVLSFQQNPNSFCKMPGVGGAPVLPTEHSCSPLTAKFFRIRFYAKSARKSFNCRI